MGGSSGQCRGNSDNSSQFCHVLNQMYSNNNYQYYDGAGAGQQAGHGPPAPTEQKCVTDYLAAYRHSHKQHYIQVSVTFVTCESRVYLLTCVSCHSIAASLDQSPI